jgi:hypothetical protein
MILLLRLLTYQDSSAAKVSAGIFLKLVLYIIPLKPVASTSESPYLTLFGKELLTAALETLHDAYHQEIHAEAINMITTLYVALIRANVSHGWSKGLQCARDVFKSLPEKNVLGVVEVYEGELMSKETGKEQNAVTRAFLEGIKGLKVSQWGKTKPSFILNHSEKSLLASAGGKVEKGGLMDEEGASLGLENLF